MKKGWMVRVMGYRQREMLFSVIVSFFCIVFLGSCFQPASADEVGARAALVMDAGKGKILYAKNPHTQLAPASTTKVMTGIVALDRLHPDTVVTVSKNAAETPSVSPHLREGDRLKVHDLLTIALMRSVNGAAVALAEAAAGSEEGFTVMMNEKVRRMGLENTRFINASGLPGPGEQYTTAYELSLILKEALRYPLIKEIINTRTKEIYTLDGRRLAFRNTNELLWADDNVLGGKTGYTRAAGHCLVCAGQKDGGTLITALLGESVRGRLWEDTAFLLSRGSDVLSQKAEPAIYFSSLPQKRAGVVLASYSPKNGSKKALVRKVAAKRTESKKTLQAKVKKSKSRATLAKADDKKKRVIVAKAGNKKKGVTVASKKGKKSKALSAQNRENVRKS